MLEFKEEASGIYVSQFIAEEFCRSLVSHVRSSGFWEDAGVRQTGRDGAFYSAFMPEVRSASRWCGPDEKEIYRDFDQKIDSEVKPFINRICRLGLTEHKGDHIVRYKQGGHYVPHVDAGLDVDDRYFTFVCYLNDDFEGGNTRFTSFDYSSTPRTGKMVLFPALYTHQAEPVMSGEKYVFITWITGPLPIEWI